MRRTLAWAAAGAWALGALLPARASATGEQAVTTTVIHVSVAVPASCTFSAASFVSLSFDPAAGTGDAGAVGSLSLRCTKGTSYVVALNNGSNPDAEGTRRASGSGSLTPADAVRYHIYRETSGGAFTEWTAVNTRGGTTASTVVDEVLAFSVKVLASENPDPKEGTYVDTVTATITF